MIAQRSILHSGVCSASSRAKASRSGKCRVVASGAGSMQVFVVRHEKRDHKDPTFLSPLLPEGMADAETVLVERISSIRPTHIYASPFLRVLQTVQPYIAQSRNTGNGGSEPLHVNIEYSLYESPNPDGKGYVGQVHRDWNDTYFIQPDYVSFLDPDELRGDWGFGESISERTARFLAHLKRTHEGTDARILLASHQYTIHSLLSLTTGQDVDSMNFPQGEVAELEWWAADLPELEECTTSANA